MEKFLKITTLKIKKDFPEEFEIINKINFGNTFKEKLFCFINNILELPKCYCGKNLKFLNSNNGYRKFCSKIK